MLVNASRVEQDVVVSSSGAGENAVVSHIWMFLSNGLRSTLIQSSFKMARDRKCILCETIHVSKQEMDEHMRSMLHHRELEKLKGRDCGHECRVCKVTVVSLTDYASHISSPTHKQNVEAAEQKHAGNDREDYFDQKLVDLIEKRKELIRKEKEAAAVKLAKEEDDCRRKEEFQQRLKEAKERYQREYTWQQPSQGFGGSGQHKSWYGSNRYSARSGEPRPWHCSQQGKSATWHAQEPPNFQKWGSEECVGGSLHSQGGWSRRQWDQGGLSGNQQNRLPWLSSGGSSNGVYGQNNISQYQQRGRPLGSSGPINTHPPPPSFSSRGSSQFQNTASNERSQPSNGVQVSKGQTAESEHNGSKTSKTCGSNPKLDKACRWSPYPVTKGSESGPHKDTNPNSSEKHPKVPKPQKQDTAPETSAVNKLSRPEREPGPLPSSGRTVEAKERPKTDFKTKPRESSSSSSSRSSSAQREGHQNSASAPSSQKVTKSSLQKDKKTSSLPVLATQLSKVSGQGNAQSKPTSKQSGLGCKAPLIVPLKSRQERQLPEVPRKERQTVLEKRGSLDSSGSDRMEISQHIVEEQQRDCAQSQIGVNKENSCRQDAAKPNSSVRPEKPALKSSDSRQFLQSLQVSTSTMENSESAASSRDEENSGKVEERTCSLAPDEALQAVEAAQSSESDTSRSGDAQTVSGSNTSQSKLELPPVLKRDLTKHISSKSKAGGHEPNLNIARRVRNLSESRRSDSEKDSGLKPTVRQLISSSGSRRNVNWEQVYQEVRKKQDKGKGMPRFGIEMVPNEQEDQSQEEDDIPRLEGLSWESLMEVSAPGATRKRSLSESSLAPESTASLFKSLMSKEMSQRENLSSEQQGSSISTLFAQGSKDVPCQQEVDHTLDQFGAKTQKQPEKLTSATVKALQRSDSLLGDSSSGTEQFDAQGTGKRRRAAGDAHSAETSCLEHNSKRRKVKTKKDRLQIDQLLAVSLREEELSRSLQTVDSSLIQARAALEAAYIEVQRLMVVKQQVAVEMSTLRNKRIELLKGMQDTAAAAALSPSPPAQRASAPSSSLPFMSAVIKEEPQSPVHVSSEPDPLDNVALCAHSTTPELPVAPAAASSPNPALSFQPSPERNPELYQTKTEHTWENLGDNESSSGPYERVDKAVQATRNYLKIEIDTESSIKLLSLSRKGSDVGGVVDCAATKTFEIPSVPSVLNLPASPSELSSGKRVRKLKKRKVLKKAQGTEQLESSDTEVDGEFSRPRWLRPRRRPSGGSQVSTSTLPTDDREGDVNMEEVHRQKVERKHMVELPHMASTELRVNLDSEESMEVTAVCQQPHTDVPHPTKVPHSSRPVPQNLACNEVTSTSDMDICKSSESDLPCPVALPRMMKNSSDVSSDHGEDEMPTEGGFEGHQEAVNAMQIHNGLLYTCSGDRTVRAFDLVTHKCVGVYGGHSSKVSCLWVSAAPCLHHRLYTGSSDQTIRCYSLKTQELEHQFSLSDRVLCLHSRWKTLYAGLANGTVVTFNLKTNKQMEVFECHGPRAVSCLATSQEGARRILLVGSYDSTISVRDAKNGLLLRTLEGHIKTILCMKVVNDLVFSGSSDQCVYTHNIHTGKLVRVYKGHSHAVTVVSILGKVMVTACLDKLVRVYDLQSHDQLQVYGGHKDMVMCMTIHKNLIYTGCYDGSVQATKLNLMQNYRCSWHGCSLVFGVTEHLQQHLINDHTSANFQTLKCRWKNCEEFFSSRNSSKQGMLMHMCKHAEEELDLEP
ncbi:zinc finger protein 106 isoform X2 [Hippoglossus hippoglossus]|uniref:zinc finger protein 106 isoform X2 n=1 Tax=Hippoglossus hippoglossus TaxID=8267 RepID=UPI00148B9010|nr:zinc finger protein 106 isoform X2 [Hippoglossus hippoglossus]